MHFSDLSDVMEMEMMEMVVVYCEVHAIAPDGTRKARISIVRTMLKQGSSYSYLLIGARDLKAAAKQLSVCAVGACSSSAWFLPRRRRRATLRGISVEVGTA